LALQTTARGVVGTGSLARGLTVDVGDLLSRSATPGAAYTLPGPTPVTFTAGATSGTRTVAVGIVGDALSEDAETINLRLTNLSDPFGGQVTIDATAATRTVTIADDDPLPAVTLSLAGSPLAEQGGVATVTATLSAVAGRDVTGTLGFGGSATLGADYTAAAASVIIPAGQTSASITLTALDDAALEADETAVGAIAGAVN